MIEKILGELKDKVSGDLMSKVGLNSGQVDGAIGAAGDSVKNVLGGGGLDLGNVLNLFSSAKNTSGADDLLGKLGGDYLSRLTGSVGLDAAKAGSVKDMVVPVLTSLLSDKIGGSKEGLAGLLGGAGKGLLGGLGDKVGGLGKLFG